MVGAQTTINNQLKEVAATATETTTMRATTTNENEGNGSGGSRFPGRHPAAACPADEWLKIGALLGFWMVGML